jgi:glycosyltransferase involved in cell wall biosynthesis
MRILDVSPWTAVPPMGGGAVRTYHLLRHLSRKHEVRQFSQPGLHQIKRTAFATDVQVTASYREHRFIDPISALMWEWCRRSWIYQPVLSGAILRRLRPALLRQWLQWADVVLVEAPWQFSHFARASLTVPLVLASHNVEVSTRMSTAEAAGIPLEKSRWFRYVERLEREAVRRADLILAVSDRDRREYTERYGVEPGRVAEIPNGSDTERFAPVSPDEKRDLRRLLGLPERQTAVYIAAGPKPADRVGLRWVRRTAEVLQDVTFLVVGGVVRRPKAAGNVVETGFVDEPWLYLQAADVSLCPIQHGGGTKIKLWDSLSVGLPTIVFEEALLGTGLRPGEHLLIAEKDERALAAVLRRVLEDRSLADRLRAASREFVVPNHDWRTIAGRLEAALVDLVAATGRAAGSMRARRLDTPDLVVGADRRSTGFRRRDGDSELGSARRALGSKRGEMEGPR